MSNYENHKSNKYLRMATISDDIINMLVAISSNVGCRAYVETRLHTVLPIWRKPVGEEIYIRYIDPELPKIELIDGRSDWFDLYSRCDVSVKAGDSYLIPLNVCMELPEGYEAHIQPRSSTFKNWGVLMATSGVIDNSFSGNNDEWRFMVYATRDAFIPKGTRIAQFRIMENQPKVTFRVCQELPNSEGRGGYGSTGTDAVVSKK